MERRVNRFRRQEPIVVVPNDSKRIDSLQARINYLESVNGNKQQVQGVVRDTVAAVEKVATPNYRSDKAITTRSYPSAINAPPDTVTKKRKWYQRLFATGPKEKSVTEERTVTDTTITATDSGKTNTDTVAVKMKWYQRLFSTGPREQVERRDTIISSRTVSPDKALVTDTVTRKTKWYQRLFSTGTQREEAARRYDENVGLPPASAGTAINDHLSAEKPGYSDCQTSAHNND